MNTEKMRPDLEELLPGLRHSVRGDPRAPQAVYQRLKFLAQVLRGAETGQGSGPVVLWLDERGDVRAQSITETGIVVGRAPESDVVLTGSRVSRRHCTVRLASTGGRMCGVEIEDLGSSNGTLVNGVALAAAARPHGLHDGDVVEVGGVALAVVFG